MRTCGSISSGRASSESAAPRSSDLDRRRARNGVRERPGRRSESGPTSATGRAPTSAPTVPAWSSTSTWSPDEALHGHAKPSRQANPLSTGDRARRSKPTSRCPTLNLGDWKRLKCNRPTRSTETAITDKEWDEAQVEGAIPKSVSVDIGLDVALEVGHHRDRAALDRAQVHAPGRSDRDLSRRATTRLAAPRRDQGRVPGAPVGSGLDFVMDMSRAEDIAAWLEDEMGVT